MRRRTSSSTLCRCGHPYVAHEHLRRGTDCSLCTRDGCATFRLARPGGLARRLLHLREEPPAELRSDRFRLVVVH